jgi:hypothetical protein
MKRELELEEQRNDIETPPTMVSISDSEFHSGRRN